MNQRAGRLHHAQAPGANVREPFSEAPCAVTITVSGCDVEGLWAVVIPFRGVV